MSSSSIIHNNNNMYDVIDVDCGGGGGTDGGDVGINRVDTTYDTTRPHDDLAMFELMSNTDLINSSSSNNNNYHIFDDDTTTNIMDSNFNICTPSVLEFFATGRPVGSLKKSTATEESSGGCGGGSGGTSKQSVGGKKKKGANTSTKGTKGSTKPITKNQIGLTSKTNGTKMRAPIASTKKIVPAKKSICVKTRIVPQKIVPGKATATAKTNNIAVQKKIGERVPSFKSSDHPLTGKKPKNVIPKVANRQSSTTTTPTNQKQKKEKVQGHTTRIVNHEKSDNKTGKKEARKNPKMKKGPSLFSSSVKNGKTDVGRVGTSSKHPITDAEMVTDHGDDDFPIVGVDLCPHHHEESLQHERTMKDYYPPAIDHFLVSGDTTYDHIFNSSSPPASTNGQPTSKSESSNSKKRKKAKNNKNKNKKVANASIPSLNSSSKTKEGNGRLIQSNTTGPMTVQTTGLSTFHGPTKQQRLSEGTFSSSMSNVSSNKRNNTKNEEKKRKARLPKAMQKGASHFKSSSEDTTERLGQSRKSLKRPRVDECPTQASQTVNEMNDFQFVGGVPYGEVGALAQQQKVKDGGHISSSFSLDAGTSQNVHVEVADDVSSLEQYGDHKRRTNTKPVRQQSSGTKKLNKAAIRGEKTVGNNDVQPTSCSETAVATAQEGPPSPTHQKSTVELKCKQMSVEQLMSKRAAKRYRYRSNMKKRLRSLQAQNERNVEMKPSLEEVRHVTKHVPSPSDTNEDRNLLVDQIMPSFRHGRSVPLPDGPPSQVQHIPHPYRQTHLKTGVHHTIDYPPEDGSMPHYDGDTQNYYRVQYPSFDDHYGAFFETWYNAEIRSSWLDVIRQVDCQSYPHPMRTRDSAHLQAPISVDSELNENTKIEAHQVGMYNTMRAHHTEQKNTNNLFEKQAHVEEERKVDTVPSPSTEKVVLKYMKPHLPLEQGVSQSHSETVSPFREDQVKLKRPEIHQASNERGQEPTFAIDMDVTQSERMDVAVGGDARSIQPKYVCEVSETLQGSNPESTGTSKKVHRLWDERKTSRTGEDKEGANHFMAHHDETRHGFTTDSTIAEETTTITNTSEAAQHQAHDVTKSKLMSTTSLMVPPPNMPNMTETNCQLQNLLSQDECLEQDPQSKAKLANLTTNLDPRPNGDYDRRALVNHSDVMTNRNSICQGEADEIASTSDRICKEYEEDDVRQITLKRSKGIKKGSLHRNRSLDPAQKDKKVRYRARNPESAEEEKSACQEEKADGASQCTEIHNIKPEDDDVPLISLKRIKSEKSVPFHRSRRKDTNGSHNEIGDDRILDRDQKPSIETNVAVSYQEKFTMHIHGVAAVEQSISTDGLSGVSQILLETKSQRKMPNLHETKNMNPNDDDVLLISLKRKKVPTSKASSKTKKRSRMKNDGVEIAQSMNEDKRRADAGKEALEETLHANDTGGNVLNSEEEREGVAADSCKKRKLVVDDYGEAELTGDSCKGTTTEAQMIVEETEFLETPEQKPETMRTIPIMSDDGKYQMKSSTGSDEVDSGNHSTATPLLESSANNNNNNSPNNNKNNNNSHNNHNNNNNGVEQSFGQSIDEKDVSTAPSEMKPSVSMTDNATNEPYFRSDRSKCRLEETVDLAETKTVGSLTNDGCQLEDTHHVSSSYDFPFDIEGCKVLSNPPEVKNKEVQINSFLENACGIAGPKLPPTEDILHDDVMETTSINNTNTVKRKEYNAENPPSLSEETGPGNDFVAVMMTKEDKIENQVEREPPVSVTTARGFRPIKKKVAQAKVLEKDDEAINPTIDEKVMSEEGKADPTKREENTDYPTPKDETANVESDRTSVPAHGETRFVFHESHSKPSTTDATTSTTTDTSTTTTTKSRSRPTSRSGGTSKTPSWFQFHSQQDAEAEQERLLRASAARVRTQAQARVMSTSDPSPHTMTFTTPVVDVHRQYPDHWQYLDLHARLGLPRTASDSMIKAHYRRLALIYHPDRNVSSNVDTKHKFQAVTESYHLLMRN